MKRALFTAILAVLWSVAGLTVELIWPDASTARAPAALYAEEATKTAWSRGSARASSARTFARVPASADDWPAYRKDGARSAVAAARLDFPLGTAWVYRLPQAPRPAWPDCGRAFSIFDFDYAVMPVVAGGLVYLASSADDTVYALDSADGSLRWT